MFPVGFAIVSLGIRIISGICLSAETLVNHASASSAYPFCHLVFEAPMSRLLLVDDNPSIYKIAATLLGSTNVHISWARSAAEALELIANEEPFDVALVDTTLPEEDGWELLGRMRGGPKTANMPIAMMAGVLDDTDDDLIKNAPIQAFILKPIDLTDLAERVQSLAPETPDTPVAGAYMQDEPIPADLLILEEQDLADDEKALPQVDEACEEPQSPDHDVAAASPDKTAPIALLPLVTDDEIALETDFLLGPDGEIAPIIALPHAPDIEITQDLEDEIPLDETPPEAEPSLASDTETTQNLEDEIPLDEKTAPELEPSPVPDTETTQNLEDETPIDETAPELEPSPVPDTETTQNLEDEIPLDETAPELEPSPVPDTETTQNLEDETKDDIAAPEAVDKILLAMEDIDFGDLDQILSESEFATPKAIDAEINADEDISAIAAADYLEAAPDDFGVALLPKNAGQKDIQAQDPSEKRVQEEGQALEGLLDLLQRESEPDSDVGDLPLDEKPDENPDDSPVQTMQTDILESDAPDVKKKGNP